jgi:hypothetical protein
MRTDLTRTRRRSWLGLLALAAAVSATALPGDAAPFSVIVVAQADANPPSPPPAQASPSAERFDCYAATPRSHEYEIAAYDQAFKELAPLARDGCAPAQHLLAVMYGKGQGVAEDPVRAYAWLLAAFSAGLTPFGGDGARTPVLGDDPDEFEIVQYGARLSDEQIARAEGQASRLVNPRAIAANGAIGPTGVADAIKELRPRRAGYSLNGKLATLTAASGAPPNIPGVKSTGNDGALAQLVTSANRRATPHQLQFIEATLKDIAEGAPGGARNLSREMDLATNEGERFAWLERNAEVRIARFGVNEGFASQVEPTAGGGGATPGQAYWIDSCSLHMKDARDELLLHIARGDQCQ